MRAWEEADTWSCAYCDVPFGPRAVCEVDHVVPLARGGPHDLHNLAPACSRCNLTKSDALPDDWGWMCRSSPESGLSPDGHTL